MTLKFYKRVTVNGATMLEHRFVVERHIGRKLKSGEVVHHIDENIQNNSPDNLMVMRSNADHAGLHSGLSFTKDELNDHYYCPDIKGANRRCKKCEKSISPATQSCLCRKCFDKENASKIMPSGEELLSRIVEMKGNFVRVGTYYGVTDNAVRRWCKKFGLSSKSMDYRKAKGA